MRSSFLIVLSFCVSSHLLMAQRWEPVLKINEKADVVFGSKQALINAVRQGQDVKIAWGWKRNGKSMEHISVPTWTAILNEEDVLFHIDPQVFGSIVWDSLAGTFEGEQLTEEWRVIIDTNGTFDAVWYDRSTHKIVRRIPQHHRMTWFVQGVRDETAVPFYEQ